MKIYKINITIFLGIIFTGLFGVMSFAANKNTIQQGDKPGAYINWEEGKRYIQARGVGFWPPKRKNIDDEEWYKIMAEDAAKIDAYGNLLEMIKGMIVEREKTVGDLVLESSKAQTYISGVVKGARVISPPQHQGKKATLIMRMPIDGNLAEAEFISPEIEEIFTTAKCRCQDIGKEVIVLKRDNQLLKEKLSRIERILKEMKKKQNTISVLAKKMKKSEEKLQGELTRQSQEQTQLIESTINQVAIQEPKKESTFSFKDIPTGLVIDARGMKIVPVQFIRLLDENLNEVYSGRFIDREFATKLGGAGYVKGLEGALKEKRLFNKGVSRPLVVQPLGTFQGKGQDFVLKNVDAQKLRDWLDVASFLREARVIIAL